LTEQTLTIRFTRQDGLVAVAVVERGRSCVLGRDLNCDVRLDGRKVSRRHLRLDNRQDGIIVVADAGSHNGTFVNGVRVNDVGVSVSVGDLVVAGEWEGRVELRAGTSPTATRPPNMMPAISTAPTGGQETFDGSTDPNLRRLSAMSVETAPRSTQPAASNLGGRTVPPTPNAFATPLPAPQARSTSTPPQPPSPQAAQAAQASRPTTMVLPMSMQIAEQQGRALTPGKDWNWEESAAQSPDTLRAARVEENPIVRRFAETSTQLDFRGLSDLPVGEGAAAMATMAGMRAPTAGVDGIALRLVFKVTEALQTTDSMDDFLREMCEQLSQAARAKGVVVLLPDGTGNLVPRVVKQRRPDEKMQLSRTVIDYVVKNRAALTTEDAAADERFARGESVLRFDLKAVLCVPLVRRNDGKAGIADSGGDVVGVLYLTRDLPFTNTERDLVAALAHLIAMGLERTRLREEFANAERTKRSLERFHAPDVVRRLMMESSAGVHRDGLFLEPLTATVLFCDLAGFTTYCEAHEPEQVGRLLNSYLGTMTETVFAHGGTVDKFIGDAVMCIFGAPFMSGDDALRGVKCAVEMRRNFRALVGSGACGEDARALDVHIGVNTGKVVAGTVGSPRRMEYTALGDTVNTAARLEGVAKKGQIVVGTLTAQLVGQHVPLRPLGAVSLKGKGAAVELFEVPETA
jgi:adenylate cyclase